MLNEEGYFPAVMAGHIFNKNIDQNYPASLSKNFLQDILRQQIGFDGVIISDDMQMGAISENYGLKEALILSVNAGCNILVFSNNTADKNDKDIAYKAVDIIFEALKNGEISQEKIDQSYQKIMELKAKFGII
jgi:beta-N-acetylhexosaminidase